MADCLSWFWLFVCQFCSGLEFQDRAPAPNLEIQSKKSQGQETLTLRNFRFSGNFCFYKAKFPASKKFADFWVMLDNFLVLVVIFYCQSGVISFLILTGLECSSIQKFGNYSQNIKQFASFQQNNSVLNQNDRWIYIYQWRKSLYLGN